LIFFKKVWAVFKNGTVFLKSVYKNEARFLKTDGAFYKKIGSVVESGLSF
jgi:hypothetical protein